jgi:hypothetical protein
MHTPMVRLTMVVLVTMLLAVGLLLPKQVAGAVQYTFYAAPNGSGTTCSEAAPCSLTGARDKVRTVNSAMSGDVVVSLRGGTYNLASTFTLGSNDSGRNGYNVIYQAYPNERPVLSGGQQITGWTLHDSTKNIYRATVGTSFNTRQLYVNGTRAIRARSGSGIPGTPTKTSTGYTTTDGGIRNWANPGDIEFVYRGSPNAGATWSESRAGVASMAQSGSGSAITMDEPAWTNGTVRKCCSQFLQLPTYIENAYELLDQPAEWYLNRATGVLYYIPLSIDNLSTATVIAPTLETLVAGTGSAGNPLQNVQFRGLTFTYATWLQPSSNEGFIEIQAGQVLINNPTRYMFVPGNLAFKTAENIRFERNSFTHLGATGLAFDQNSRNNTIIGNSFTDISNAAVRIGTASDTTYYQASSSSQETGNQILNNYINDVGVEHRGSVGVLVVFAADTRIANNDISEVPYSCVSLGWGWGQVTFAQNNEVAYNHIYNCLQRVGDGGGIYTLSEQSAADGSLRSKIHNNYIHDLVNSFAALYPDEASSRIDWYNNVTQRSGKWLYIWTSSINNLLVRDNFSDTSDLTNNGTSISLVNNYTAGTPWPSAAQAIINAAGLEAAYQDVKQNNLALNRPASASSTFDGSLPASKANDGTTNINGSSGWSPTSGDTSPWWQVDLGSAQQLGTIELVTRQGLDQANTRRNFEVRASNDSSFASYTVLGSQGNASLVHESTWRLPVANSNSFRYLRVAKTTNEYFFIAELRAYAPQGSAPPPAPTATPTGPTPTAAPTATPGGTALVTVQSVSTGKAYTVGTAQVSALPYIDRSYTISALDSSLNNQPLVRTSNDDDMVTANPHLTLNLSGPAILAVAYRDNATSIPSWLSSWTLTTKTVTISGFNGQATNYKIYEKSFAAGSVSLGGNERGATGADSNYFVIARPGSLATITKVDDSVRGTGQNQFNFSANWTYDSGCTVCYSNTQSYSPNNTTPNATVEIAFTGTQIKIYGNTWGGIAAVSIDGGTETNVNFAGSPALKWTSPTLSAGPHTLRIRATGTTATSGGNRCVVLDYVEITS